MIDNGKSVVTCVRCGRDCDIEIHHIEECHVGGSNDPKNLEPRCQACHDYEHARRHILVYLEYEKERGQADRIRVYERRLEALEVLNTVELIRQRGTYISYWTDLSIHKLPRRIPTKKELNQEAQLEMILTEAMRCSR